MTCPLPQANFTSSVASFTASFFDGSGGNPTTWSWDFGDGGTSTQQNPSHTYTNPGTYTVCLISGNSCGTDTTCSSVTVCAQPASSFSYTTNGLSAAFTSTSTNGTTYFWNFGDGLNSTQQNPTHAYATMGTYTVCLIVYNACYSDTSCVQVTICPLPVPAFSFTANQFQYSFTDNTSGANSAWNWTFGDGGTSTQQNPSHTYTVNGTYTVCLTVTNACGNDSTCQSLVVNVVGMEDGILAGLELWPVPTDATLQVRVMLTDATPCTLRIRDLAGRLLTEVPCPGRSGEWRTDLDVSSLAAGMYLLEWSSAEGRVARRFVAE